MKILSLQKGKSADYEENAKQNNPGFWRKEKGTYGHPSENQQHEANILGFFIYVKTFLFTVIIVHDMSPHIFYEKPWESVCRCGKIK